MSEYLLSAQIIKRSLAKTWDSAKREWKLDHIYMDANQTCLCGHYPISEICVLKNQRNGKFTAVGNCCVEKFMDISSHKLFAAIKRVKRDNSKALNADIMQMAFEKKYINDWELGFYLDTWRKKKLSPKQLQVRKLINAKVLRKI